MCTFDEAAELDASAHPKGRPETIPGRVRKHFAGLLDALRFRLDKNCTRFLLTENSTF